MAFCRLGWFYYYLVGLVCGFAGLRICVLIDFEVFHCFVMFTCWISLLETCLSLVVRRILVAGFCLCSGLDCSPFGWLLGTLHASLFLCLYWANYFTCVGLAVDYSY